MELNIKDVIALDDGNNYVVVSKTNYNNETYYYLLDINNNKNFKILKLNINNNKLMEFEDQNLIKELLPMFLKESAKHIE